MGAVCSMHPWMRNTHELTSTSSRTDSRSACQKTLRFLWMQLFISGSQDCATGLYSQPAESSVHTYTILTSDACWYCFSIYVHISRILPFFQVKGLTYVGNFYLPTLLASFHAHLIVHYFIIVTMCGEVKYLSLSVFSFLYSRFTSCLLCQNILLGTPVQICSSCRHRR